MTQDAIQRASTKGLRQRFGLLVAVMGTDEETAELQAEWEAIALELDKREAEYGEC